MCGIAGAVCTSTAEPMSEAALLRMRDVMTHRGPDDAGHWLAPGVALAQVVEALEQDAALEALGDLARVVLEAPELGDRRLVDARPVAEDPDVGVAAHDAARDHAAGDRAET